MKVLHGLCQGGPKNGQSLASMQGVPGANGRVTHPDDPNGFYVHRNGGWVWITTKGKAPTK